MSEKSYSSDLIIFKDFIKEKWWRKEGHRLHLEDLEILKDIEIEVLVIGTGSIGKMKVPEEVLNELKQKEIEVIVCKSAEAVEKYNNLAKTRNNIALAIHLTC
ncbi:MAG: hypothetical protein H7644_09880 [Candidatus Heimdallarchaeota archaeon]|nr:hypothetical protein [Candidatus Heimdallarchaeota archaeon]MCK5144064.1 hypothetical protein [Candidatus Heimdallarchaeota archaeon]